MTPPPPSCYLLLRATDLRTQSAQYITLLGIGDTLNYAVALAKSDYMMRLPIIDPQLQEKVEILEHALLNNLYHETIDIGIDTWYVIHEMPLNKKIHTALRPQFYSHVITAKIPSQLLLTT